MEELHPRCAGIDIGKRSAMVCIRTHDPDAGGLAEQTRTWGTMTSDILALREELIAARVTCVVMEATSDYWRPFYYLLEDLPECQVLLVNARHVGNVPGRKSDVNDAKWLAQIGAHGLLRASFVPPPRVRQLRDLTRTRTQIVRERAREVARLEKLLEGAGIKLSSVISDLTGKSGRAMLLALADGERDPQVLAGLAHLRMRGKQAQLVQALTGFFTTHHGFLVRTHFTLIDAHDQAIAEITARIEEEIEPFRGFRELICSIPGISTTVADIVIAETGGDMSIFPTAGHLASWAGVCPGINESAGVHKAVHVLPGNKHLKGALGIAALSASRSKNTFYAAKYKRLKARRGGKRALVALEHTMLTTIWTMAHTGALYDDPGADYYQRQHPERATRRHVKELQRLGYDVTLQKAS